MFDQIDAVLFDLDGTLIDSMWMWESIDIEYLKRFGLTCPKDLQPSIEGMSFSETAIYFKERFHICDPIEKIKKDWNEMAYEKYKYEVSLKKGVFELLHKLKEKKIKMGIATSNSVTLVTMVLEQLKVRSFFDAVHTSCEVAKGKPSPDIYLFVADKLNVTPKKCLVFEDIISGILAGKSAGMKTCAVYDKYSEAQDQQKRQLADFYIPDFTVLL